MTGRSGFVEAVDPLIPDELEFFNARSYFELASRAE